MAIADTAARKLLYGGAGGTIAEGVAGDISFDVLGGLWQLVTGFFAALAGAAHLLVLPLEALWRWLLATVADAAGAIVLGLDGLWLLVTGFLANIFAALAEAAHLLVLPLEVLWGWLLTTVADAAGAIVLGLDGLWQSFTGFFAGIFANLSAALAGSAHQFVLPLEALWQWLLTTVADAAGTISVLLNGLCQLVTGFFPETFAHLSTALADAAHELVLQLEALWLWIQSAAAAALPVVLGVAAVLLLVALVRFCGPTLCVVTVVVCKALVVVACYFGLGLYFVAFAVHRALACLLPPFVHCVRCCAVVTMKPPGAAGMLILRAAFAAIPVLYIQILRAADPVVGRWSPPSSAREPSPGP